MAPRKKNPLDDVAKTVGNWLGGAARAYADITDRSRDVQPGRAARVQAALDATRAIGKVADAATGGFGSAVVSDAQRMAKTGSSTPSALYKTAAVNMAAGVGGVKAAQVAGRAVAATGIPARAVNKLTGQEVLIHASPKQNLKTIRAQKSADRTRFAPDESLSFAVRPAAKGSQRYMPDYVGDLKSAMRGSSVGVAGGTKPQSIYVTKAPKKNVVPYQAQGMWGRTTSNQKVVQEIGIAGKTNEQIVKEIASASRRHGQPLRPEFDRVEKIKMERARKRWAKQNPPVKGPAID